MAHATELSAPATQDHGVRLFHETHTADPNTPYRATWADTRVTVRCTKLSPMRAEEAPDHIDDGRYMQVLVRVDTPDDLSQCEAAHSALLRWENDKVGPSTKRFCLDNKRTLDAFYEAQIAAGYAAPLKDAEGRPLSVTEARKAKGVSFDDRFHTLHDCRHTYAIVRLTGQDGEPRADLQAIADQLGHVDLQMVSRIYARHRSEIQKAAEAAFHERNATSDATLSENQPQIGLG